MTPPPKAVPKATQFTVQQIAREVRSACVEIWEPWCRDGTSGSCSGWFSRMSSNVGFSADLNQFVCKDEGNDARHGQQIDYASPTSVGGLSNIRVPITEVICQ